MASKVLNTTTIITKKSSTVDIYTYYSEDLEYIIAFISDEVKSLEDVEFLENELGIIKKGYNDVLFFINELGELVVIADNPDKFSVDSDGYLILTE